jgi:lauroyl/myristoyl acyltransferase
MEAVRTGDRERDIEVNTQRFNDVLERIVREQPESWLWGHRRWKNQPPENPQDLYALSPEELAAFLRRARP